MRYYLDFEFIHKYRELSPISVGMVSEDGREFYAVYSDMPTADIGGDRWIMDNVMSSIDHDTYVDHAVSGYAFQDFTLTDPAVMPVEDIRRGLLDFIKPSTDIEIWVSSGGFDFTCFSMTIGNFDSIPTYIPTYFMDLNQLRRTYKIDGGPRQAAGLHNALDDARHNKVRYDYMMEKINGDS